MFYEVSLGTYGAYTIVTLGVFLPKVPLVYHGLAWRFGRTICTHLRYRYERMELLQKKKSFHELNTTTKLSRRRRRRPFTEHQSDLSTRPVSLTQQQSLAYLGLLVTCLVMLGYTEFSEVDRMQLADDV